MTLTITKTLAVLSPFLPLALGFVPLVDKHFPYTALPEKVDPSVGLPRGPQTGYNICNSTTEGPNSLCQTAIINSLDDFCLWAPPTPNKTVGDIEGQMVAWCSKPGHGTRIMPAGTLTGVQLTRTPDYIQVVGFMDQTKINMVKGDSGGEMDPHGADQRGNPIGGVVYTQAFADNGTYTQAVQWHNFNGNNIFCFKACDPSRPHAAQLCQHIFDTEGCTFNAPSNARNGVFESCAGDSQAPPGSPNGTVVPKSSQCSTFASTAIYGGGETVRVPGATFVPSATPTGSSAKFTGSGSGSGAGPVQTQSSDGLKMECARVAYGLVIASALGMAILL